MKDDGEKNKADTEILFLSNDRKKLIKSIYLEKLN